MPSSTRPRIAIATSFRFHVLDLARELTALGHDVRFYSLLPDSRAERFGLDRRHCRSLLPLAGPAFLWQRYARNLAPGAQEKVLDWALNRAIIARLEPCDLFVGMSGMIVEAAKYARARYGAAVFVHRGSKHVLHQKEILDAAGAEAPSPYNVARELECYAMADKICIPSQHVARSFESRSPHGAKLFVNTYGVNLDQFPKRTGPGPERKTVLYVGNWTLQKGVDVLVEAIRSIPDAHLLHVGALGDVPFPDEERFEHVEPVDQSRLSEFYHRASMFALASRQDGFGMVLTQALASGLPLVCTADTAGGDLRHTEALSRRIDVVPAGDAAALASAIRARLDGLEELPDLADDDRELLSWRHYGARYSAEIERTFGPAAGR